MMITLNAFRRSLQRRKDGDSESGIALLMALFVMLMVTTLAVTLLAAVLNETKPTMLSRKLTRTIDGAQGGLQVVLNQLRAANDGSGQGVLTELPCTSSTAASLNPHGTAFTVPGAAFSGTVSAATGTSYTANVAYYMSDPSDMTDAQLASNAMSCPLTAVPGYAYVQSAGTGGAVAGLNSALGNRTIHGTYQFSTDNTNIAGGRMIEFGTTLCLTTVDSNPHVGTQLKMATCLAIGTSTQTWSYRSDLSLLWAGNTAANLCVQNGGSGTVATLQTCSSPANTVQPSTYTYTNATQQAQEWGFNDSGHLSTANNDGSVTNGAGGTCLQPQSPASDTQPSFDGASVVITTCNGGTQGYTAWNPDPQVGAGKAGGVTTGVPGSPTYQLVNYQEFGRCLDITGQNVNADHLIDYPCKQAPDSSKLTFNQVWTFTGSPGGTGTLSVTTGGTKYCLTAPSGPNGAGYSLPLTKVCGSADGQTWQATGKQSGNYAGSYEFISKATGTAAASNGLCLTANASYILTTGSSTITLATCDGTAKQKWNAPPNPLTTNVTNLNEDLNAS